MAYPEHYLAPHLDAERAIVDRLIRAALGRGWAISVFDGEEFALKRSTDYDAIAAEIAATDETMLRLWEPANYADATDENEWAVVGRIWLIHGNGEDVISDHTDRAAMNAFIDDVLSGGTGDVLLPAGDET